MDRQILQEAGLAGLHDIVGWAALGCVLLAAIFGAAHNWIIPRWAESKFASEANEKQPFELSTYALTQRRHFEETDTDGELRLLLRIPEEVEDSDLIAEAIIKDEDDSTLAWAAIQQFANGAIWPLNEYDRLLDGDNEVSLGEGVPINEIKAFLDASADIPVEIIGIGLESSAGQGAADPLRMLSINRAQTLQRVVRLSVADDYPTAHFRALGLGRALTILEEGSDAERRQRSAMVATIAVFQEVPKALSTADAIAFLLMRASLAPIDLADYEYAEDAATRLSPRLSLPGQGTVPWQVPALTADEAVQRRGAGDNL